jgi:hypothetical protein
MSNLLTNPGFENGWWKRTHDGREFDNIFVPVGWTAFWSERENPEPGIVGNYRRPEMKVIPRATPFLDPARVRSGDFAVQYFTFFGAHDAGVYQQVSGLPRGATVKLSAFYHGWSSHADDPHYSGGQASWAQYGLVGIDPTGGTDPWSSDVVWSPPGWIFDAYGEPLEVSVEVAAGTVTAFLRSVAKFPLKHSDAYWDEASLVIVDVPEEPEPPELPEPPSTLNFPVTRQGTKMGYHAIGAGEVVEQIARLANAGAPVPMVKFVDHCFGGDELQRVKAVSPTTLTVVRATFGLPRENASGIMEDDADIRQIAAEGMGLLKAKLDGIRDQWPYIDYVETFVNEADYKTPDGSGYVRLARLMEYCMDIVENEWDLDVKLLLFSLNAGTPEWWDWVMIFEQTEMMQRAAAGGHLIALHEGALPAKMLGLEDEYDEWEVPLDIWFGPEHAIPDSPVDAAGNSTIPGTGALFGRYRYLKHLMHAYGAVTGIVLSEMYLGTGGYKAEHTAQIIEAVAWADEEMAKDYELVAALPFTFGGAGFGWDVQDYGFLLPALRDYSCTVAARQNALPPSGPGPGPEPRYRGAPRIQYRRVVHVIPEGATPEREAEIMAEAKRRGNQTVGWSYDDAGIGDLDQRIAVLWDVPEDERADYLAFYEAFYPGVEVCFEVDIVVPPPTGEPESGDPWDLDLRGSLPRNPNVTNPALANGWWRRRLDQIDALTFHHTVREDDDPTELARWYVYDKDPRGRPSIPYTLWIMRDGTVTLNNDLDEGCWHDETGHRNTHLSVGVVGDLRKREPTEAQYAAMVKVARWAMEHPEMSITRDAITGDMDWRKTECPGWLKGGWKNKFYALLDDAPLPPPATNRYDGRSPLTLHLQGGEGDALAAFIQTAKPRIIKVTHNRETYRWVRDRFPDLPVVFRHWVDDGEQARLLQKVRDGAVAEAAGEFMQGMLDVLASRPFAIESWNEIAHSSAERVNACLLFDLALREALDAAGYEDVNLVAMTAPVGHPHVETWYEFMVPLAERDNVILGPHCYWWGDAEESGLDRDWDRYGGRYEGMDAYLVERGLYPTFVLGEAGLCHSSTKGADWNPARGWKTAYGNSQEGKARYQADLLEALRRYHEWNRQHDYRLLGSAIFTVEGGGWDDFEALEVMVDLADEIRDQVDAWLAAGH